MRDAVGRVDIRTDGSTTIWTECRQCGDLITDIWEPPADLAQLADDATEHVCGLPEQGLDDGN